MKLITFAHAGSSAMLYRKWNKYIDKKIELCPIELPGRGVRLHQALLTEFDEILKRIYDEITKNINIEEDIIIYGQSMGALLAYELCYLLYSNGHRIRHLFVGACRPPQLQSENKKISAFDDKQFIEAITSFGGMDSSIIKNQEVYDIYFPILRADFKAFDSYVYRDKEILGIDISVFYGTQDVIVSDKDMNLWRELTVGKFSLIPVRGNHFFHINSPMQICDRINKVISSGEQCH